MPDYLLQFDRHLFHFINYTLANPFFDLVMPWLRNAKYWISLYLFIIIFCIWKYKKTGLIIILFLALTAGFADFTSASIVKPLVKRARPCHDVAVSQTEIQRIDCGSGYSFPSTHATDHFAMAFFLIILFKKKWGWIWFWAILWAGTISFAQVYVGVHFPVDVICGAIYGAFVGWLFAGVFFRVVKPQLVL